MTPDQFTQLITDAATAPDLPLWPLVDIKGDAAAFTAYDADRMILVAGLYTEHIAQDAIDRAIVYAAAQPTSEATEVVGDYVACIVAPLRAYAEASQFDPEGFNDCVFYDVKQDKAGNG